MTSTRNTSTQNLKISIDSPTANQPLISLQNVSLTINQSRLISHIDLSIMADDTISLIGPNGAGKSTLVKLMLGLLSPTEGQIKRADKLVIGYVPQKFTIPTILPLRVLDLLNQADSTRLNKQERNYLIEQLSLTDLLQRQLVHLSGGETQRVLLARALLDKPDLLILDEPMQGLDPDTEALLYQFIDELPEFLRCAMLVVSHDLHWVMKGSRHVICLNKHICCEGQPADIQDESEFQRLFGHGFTNVLHEHKFEQPYIHHHHNCGHHSPDEV